MELQVKEVMSVSCWLLVAGLLHRDKENSKVKHEFFLSGNYGTVVDSLFYNIMSIIPVIVIHVM